MKTELGAIRAPTRVLLVCLDVSMTLAPPPVRTRQQGQLRCVPYAPSTPDHVSTAGLSDPTTDEHPSRCQIDHLKVMYDK